MGGKRKVLAVILALIGAASAACLSAEMEHDIILEPDGAATWTVLQRHVVSIESDPAGRAREEEEFRTRLVDRDPPVAEALRILGGWNVDVEVLRDERPFAVTASARFSRVDRMLQGYFDRVHPDAGVRVDLDQEGTRRTLRIRFPDLAEESATEPSDEDRIVAALEVGEENLHFLLTRGRFVEARGFRIEQEGTRAIPVLDDAPEGDGSDQELTLTWDDAP